LDGDGAGFSIRGARRNFSQIASADSRIFRHFGSRSPFTAAKNSRMKPAAFSSCSIW
jgi:hypothetical protein